MKDAVDEDGVDLMGYTTWGCIEIFISNGTVKWKRDMASFMLIEIMMATVLLNA